MQQPLIFSNIFDLISKHQTEWLQGRKYAVFRQHVIFCNSTAIKKVPLLEKDKSKQKAKVPERKQLGGLFSCYQTANVAKTYSLSSCL